MKKKPQEPGKIRLTLLLIRRRGKMLLIPSPRVRGFWDLPEGPQGLLLGPVLGTFRHSIMNSRYECEVREAIMRDIPKEARWWDEARLAEIPLSTTARKALRLQEKLSSRRAAQSPD